LKLINNFARINRLPEDVRQDGSTHIKLFDSMKKEFRLLRLLWMKIYDQISAMDELSQATTRLCLKYDNVGALQTESQPGPSTSTGSSRRKKKPKELQPTLMEQDQRIQNINLLEPHELDMKMTQMEIERETGKEALSVHLGQLLYLETLKKNDFSKSGNINSEECPVCHLVLGAQWTVLRCGHCYCSDCVKSMCSNAQKSFLCPLCRHSMKYSDVSFIDNRE
jgi:E3 ubiquitin-protein ligase SHPRH